MAGALVKLGVKTARTSAKKAGSKKAADEAVRKQMGKELTDLGTPSSTAATKSPNMGKYTKGEVPVTASGGPRKKFKNKLSRLQYDYDGLTPSAKRAERMKGSDSKYYEVFKKRGMKSLDQDKKVIPTEEVRKRLLNRRGGGLLDYSTSKAKPKKKPTPPEDMGAVARGNRMSEMEAGSKKAMGRKAGDYMKKKGYKAGTGKGTVARPRGVGCAVRGYGKAMKG